MHISYTGRYPEEYTHRPRQLCGPYALCVQAGLEQRLDGGLERGALQQGAAERELGHLGEDVAQLRELGLDVGRGLGAHGPADDLEVEARQPGGPAPVLRAEEQQRLLLLALALALVALALAVVVCILEPLLLAVVVVLPLVL